jgi:uncharacterized OsmC-like protein
MKIVLLSEEQIRLEPTGVAMVVEAVDETQQYSPFHMLASALAYCTFSVMASWATHTKQPIDDLAINVRWRFSDDQPKRVSEFRMTYEWPSLPARKANAARRVAELCTIHATLKHPPEISIEVSSATANGSAEQREPGSPAIASSEAA